MYVTGANVDRPANELIAEVDDYGLGRDGVFGVQVLDNRLGAQACGQEIELAQLWIAAVQGVEHARPRRHHRACAAPAGECDVTLRLYIVGL